MTGDFAGLIDDFYDVNCDLGAEFVKVSWGRLTDLGRWRSRCPRLNAGDLRWRVLRFEE